MKNIKAIFCKNVHDLWYSHLPDDTKDAYDLSNHTKVPRKKGGALTTSNINYFYGRFSVLNIY